MMNCLCEMPRQRRFGGRLRLLPPPSSSPVPTLSAAQQDMLNTFSLKSGMNLEWSQKCLQDNEWDFERA
ncbi:hypothetical protein DKP78_20790, partial [Enterococcus faecium]